MIRSIVRVVLAVAVAAGVWSAQAGEEKKAAKEGKQFFEGVISAVDFKAGTVTVKEKAGTMTFQCTDVTKYYAKKKEGAALTDFKVGDKVDVQYTVVGGTPTCSRLAEEGSHADKKEKKEHKH